MARGPKFRQHGIDDNGSPVRIIVRVDAAGAPQH